jgi:hypothetical protein
MTCKDCIHYDICVFHTKGNENEKCQHFKNKANFVEVVRCKDCVYWEGRGYDGRCEAYHNGLIRDYTNYDDYCSYGKKRSEEE